MAMVAATGAGAYHVDPLISSAAVAGASVSASNLECKKNEAARMVRKIFRFNNDHMRIYSNLL